MEIILKHKYNGGLKDFENKTKLVNYVNNYISERIGEKKITYNKYNIHEIAYKFFGDYEIERIGK